MRQGETGSQCSLCDMVALGEYEIVPPFCKANSVSLAFRNGKTCRSKRLCGRAQFEMGKLMGSIEDGQIGKTCRLLWTL
jgi:hypothetical protein